MRAVDELLSLVSNKLEMIKTTIAIIKLEARLAGLSIFPLLLNLCMLFVVLIAIWLTAMFMIGYGINVLYDSAMIAISSILFLNFILLGVLLKYLQFNIKNMSFTKTRKILSPNKDSDDHEHAQANHSDCNRTRTEIPTASD